MKIYKHPDVVYSHLILYAFLDKRQEYDNGFDPYDPEQGNGGGGGAGGHPFQHQQQGGFNFQNGFPFEGNFPGGNPFFKMQF